MMTLLLFNCLFLFLSSPFGVTSEEVIEIGSQAQPPRSKWIEFEQRRFYIGMKRKEVLEESSGLSAEELPGGWALELFNDKSSSFLNLSFSRDDQILEQIIYRKKITSENELFDMLFSGFSTSNSFAHPRLDKVETEHVETKEKHSVLIMTFLGTDYDIEITKTERASSGADVWFSKILDRR